ncbi:MAG TPA: lanthionine synthetase C family protein [Kofleriaceae bacterium]|nr:lanthionine synthetase C family protein [Kofleriaceae bacterium]
MQPVARDENGAAWTPILSGREGAAAREVVHEIAAFARRVEPEHAGLASGAAGIAVFLAYYAAAFGDEAAADRASELLDRAADRVADTPMTSSLYAGFTGIAWAVQHLTGAVGDGGDDGDGDGDGGGDGGGDDGDGEHDPGAEIDELIGQLLARDEWLGPYDLMSGLVGLAVHALERMPRPGARSRLQRIAWHLDRLARPVAPGVAWHTAPELLPVWQREASPAGHIDLGVAHGNPGVLAVLAKIAAQGVAPDRTAALFEAGVASLLSRWIAGHPGGCFASWIAGTGGDATPSRLAWCYGDLGLAAALLVGARAVGCARTERAALELARLAAARADDAAGVVDAGLCHGALGNAHVFNRMYQATGDHRLLEAARSWARCGLGFRRPGEGAAGFSARRSLADGSLCWEADPGLLSGAAGIGLALMAACTDLTPAWDCLFLVDAAPRAHRPPSGAAGGSRS